MNVPRIITLSLIFLLVVVTALSCKKLDKDGGYYDEKTKTYKYLRPTQHGPLDSQSQVVSPVPGKPQQIQGVVTKIDDDAKSIWVRFSDRRPYMILAERLSGRNRNDKDKELRITLKYVSPLGSVTKDASFRAKWRDYTLKSLSHELVDKTILAEIDYEEQARQFWGTVFTVVTTDTGERARNINLWMVLQGLSYYFIDHGKSPQDKDFMTAQAYAQKKRYGLWRYQ